MKILLRRLLFLLVCVLALVIITYGQLAPTPVRADVGVQPVLPGGSSIKPGEETKIQMAAEVVTMNVRSATVADNTLVTLRPKFYGFQMYPVWFPGIAEVEADFSMKNPTSAAVSMTAWFPLASALENADWNFNPGGIVPRIQHFQVSMDGNPVNYEVSELPNPKGANKPALPWASFPVTFPGAKTTNIHVSYMLPLQPSGKGPEMALYYVFQTGAGWAGPIGQAELILNLPYPASVETLAGMQNLSLPPMSMGQISTGVPSGAVLEGNQARWTWKDFEPGPKDDFAVWLLKPSKWQELEAARAAVQAHPQDGQAWLDLATIYYSLSTVGRNVPALFSPFYIPPALQAYQKAAELLPEHPAPHVGLGLLALMPYSRELKNLPPDVLQSVQEELQVAKKLEAQNPSLANEGGVSSAFLEDVLSIYFYNDATATVDAVTRAVYNATQSAEATRDHATRTLWAMEKATAMACWATTGVECLTASPTATFTPQPTTTSALVSSATSQPPPTILPTPAEMTGNRQSRVILVAATVLGLIVLGTLALRRLRKRSGLP